MISRVSTSRPAASAAAPLPRPRRSRRRVLARLGRSGRVARLAPRASARDDADPSDAPEPAKTFAFETEASPNASNAATKKQSREASASPESSAPDANAASSGDASSSESSSSEAPSGLARLVPSKLRAWLASRSDAKARERLDALALAADLDPEDFVKQDALLRELKALEMHEDVVARFESRQHASGPGSVVAYLESLAALGALGERFDPSSPSPSQLSMAAAGVMKDQNISGEAATAAVTQAVAIASARRSELPAVLADLSKRAEGKPGVVRPPPGRSPAAPLHVVLADPSGSAAGLQGGSGGRAKGGGLINFVFFSALCCVLGSAAMSAMQRHATKVTVGKGASSASAASSSAKEDVGSASGLLPGGDGSGGKRTSLPGLRGGDNKDANKPGSFDPKEYNKDELSEQSIKTFADVKGCDEAKEELQEIVAYLKNPDTFTKLGGKLPKGVLLSGPPGTGKTLLARAVAGEAGVPFFYRAGSEFEEMFVGVGSKRVRQLFSAAKKKMPCIVFIDEIDAVGTSRKAFETQSRKTLNQLLTEMDGFEQNEGIIVIAATNIPEQLDPALTRPGRFDRHVHVPNPDIGGRREILTHYLADKPTDEDVDVEALARGTSGFSGAELFNLVNTAAVQAAVSGETSIGAARLDWAKDRIIMGVERKSAVLTEESKRLTAYHEAGHAVVALRTPGAMPVHKATIVPRGSALGMVTQLPDKDETSITRKQLLARLDVCMGGRVAEELIFGRDEVTTGALSDLQQATRLATYMVGEVGLSSLVGPVHVDSMSKGGRRATEALVDKEVVQLLRDSHARVTRLLTRNSKDLHVLAAEMLAKETLTGGEIQELLGMRKKASARGESAAPRGKRGEGDAERERGEGAKSGGDAAEGAGKGDEKEGDADIVIPELILEPSEKSGERTAVA